MVPIFSTIFKLVVQKLDVTGIPFEKEMFHPPAEHAGNIYQGEQDTARAYC